MKDRGMKNLAMLLTLAMVVGLLPGMSLTAYAAPTETLLTTITGTGSNAPTATSANVSYSTEGVATLTFSGSVSYQASPAWGWWGYGWTATVNAAEGYTITKCVFYDDANRTATDSSSPFVVETTEEDKTPRINGTPIDGGKSQSKGLKKIEVYGYATPAHTHSFSYAAGTGDSANTITATCTAGCPDSYDTNGISLIISAPSNLVCDDSAKAATLSGYPSTAPTGLTAAPTSISYNPGGTAPTTPGTYTASFTWGGATASVSFTLTANAYAVTLSGGANATASGATTQSVTPGQAMTTVTYTANSGYTFPAFSNSTTNGVTLTRASDTVVTVSGTPTADVSITVPNAAAIPTYTVTYKVINGTWSDGSTADKTETVASGAKPANVPTGMKPASGYTGGAWDKNPADATITEATTFTYTFGPIPTFNVTVSETPNGTVTASKTTAAAGENITLTITPASGYQVQAITVTDVNNNNIPVSNNSFTMPAEHVTVTVTFIQIPVSTYTVTVANTPNGTVTASKTTAAAGENITLTITPASGYQVQAITVTDVYNKNISVTNNSFTMPAANVFVTVTFIESPVQPTTYTVSFFTNGGGGVMNPVTVPANTIYTLPACGFTPPAGKQFKAWQLGSTEFAPGDTIKVDSNAEFVALWKDDDGSGSGGDSGHGGSSGDIVFIGGYGGAEESWEYVGGQQRAWKVSLAPMVNGSAALGIMTGESTTTDMNVYPTTTIYVFPNANPGFVLDKIIWSYIDGTASYDITEAKNFVMPAMDVVVYVTFKPLGS